MRFYDASIETVITLSDLKTEYSMLKAEDATESKTFPEYLANVIEACLLGRNDCELMDITSASALRIMHKIIASLPES